MTGLVSTIDIRGQTLGILNFVFRVLCFEFTWYFEFRFLLLDVAGLFALSLSYGFFP